MDIWEQCKGAKHLIAFNINAWRIVEAQHIISTRKLVDSLLEQHILEELIESTKPPYKEDSKLHYLLYTPFRYPPLKNGSRFGARFEHSFWYGSLELNTAMAETAYYRFHFLRASKAKFGAVVTNHTAFSAHIKTKKGIDLTQSPFSKFTSMISSPVSYQVSQALGTAMRQDNTESFYYQSTRDPNKGNNIALLTPKAFSQKKPISQSFQSWQCIVNKNIADFVRVSSVINETQSFHIELFLCSGELPFPAN
jgi:hypothetical protein